MTDHLPPSPEVLPLGLDGILVRMARSLSDAGNRAALAYHAALRQRLPGGVTETATSLTSVFVRFDPDEIQRAELENSLAELIAVEDWYHAPLPPNRTLWRIPAAFGGSHGPQLEEVADLAGLTPDQAIEDVTTTDLRVLALGFAPGQPYLGFLDTHWDIPRQTEITPQVPRGAVVTAVRQIIPFANAAPTGWRQIGQTGFRCYSRAATPPIPLKAGDVIRFEPVTAAELTRLAETGPLGGAVPENLS